jgi:hypothetical protein
LRPWGRLNQLHLLYLLCRFDQLSLWSRLNQYYPFDRLGQFDQWSQWSQWSLFGLLCLSSLCFQYHL